MKNVTFEVLEENISKGIVDNKWFRKDTLQMILMCAKMLDLDIKGVAKSNTIGLNGNVEYIAFFMN